jgi:hypothetical protein
MSRHKEVRPIIIDGFHQFARNGVWGTCADCHNPTGPAYPEQCENFMRYDHQLTLDKLVHQYEIDTRPRLPSAPTISWPPRAEGQDAWGLCAAPFCEIRNEPIKLDEMHMHSTFLDGRPRCDKMLNIATGREAMRADLFKDFAAAIVAGDEERQREICLKVTGACPNCGAQNVGGKNFCPDCDYTLYDPSQPLDSSSRRENLIAFGDGDGSHYGKGLTDLLTMQESLATGDMVHLRESKARPEPRGLDHQDATSFAVSKDGPLIKGTPSIIQPSTWTCTNHPPACPVPNIPSGQKCPLCGMSG